MRESQYSLGTAAKRFSTVNRSINFKRALSIPVTMNALPCGNALFAPSQHAKQH